ncbi:MAG: hypothetical protein LAP87_27840 [Acidobacteriia bacterium]|nr:hypothetical protein [Terriglobia bacterium]
MSKRSGVALFLLLAALFLVVNRGAYKGYFQDDEVDNLSWAPNGPASAYLKGVLSPRFEPNNFRPVGHFYFHEAGLRFGLDFPKYVLAIHLFHLLNVWLVWLLARRLGAPPLAAAAACFFFALHMALFDAVWKPMYVFDVLCATFCLLSLLLYARGRWVLAFVSFWLAYKAKEVAVMLPLVLACYEIWFGKRRWKTLAPFFMVSLSFGLQGLLLNPNRGNDYTFRFTPAALATTAVFYAGRVFLVPYLGFLAPLGALLTRNRRVWFGFAMMGLLFVPMLFLPGRLFSAYCYVPFTGLAVAFAGLAEGVRPLWLAVFLLAWLPVDYQALRSARRETLANGDEAREWIATLARYARTTPPAATFLYAGTPGGYHHWGVEGALKYFYKGGKFDVLPLADRAALTQAGDGRTTLLSWNRATHKLDIADLAPGASDLSYIEIAGAAPPWQLEKGWYQLEGAYRWIAPMATARLQRPAGARQFELRVLVGAELLEKAGPLTVRISLDDRDLEPRRFTVAGWQTTRWDLPPKPAGPALVTFHSEPPFRPATDPRLLGIAIGGFGFR